MDEVTYLMAQEAQKQSRSFIRQQREITFVSSWCLNGHESATMWPLYVQGNEGTAVQSTFDRLVESMKDYDAFEIYIGEIRYLDYNADVIDVGQFLLPLLSKRKSFEHEKELRALIWTFQHGKNNPQQNKFKSTFGLSVPVNLEELIEKVFVSPEAPTWFLNLVKAIAKR